VKYYSCNNIKVHFFEETKMPVTYIYSFIYLFVVCLGCFFNAGYQTEGLVHGMQVLSTPELHLQPNLGMPDAFLYSFSY
jgi:hypothetical protein